MEAVTIVEMAVKALCQKCDPGCLGVIIDQRLPHCFAGSGNGRLETMQQWIIGNESQLGLGDADYVALDTLLSTIQMR